MCLINTTVTTTTQPSTPSTTPMATASSSKKPDNDSCKPRPDDALMIDSGAGVCVCPTDYSYESPFYPITEIASPPKLKAAVGGELEVQGRRTIKLDVCNGLMLTLMIWVCNMNTVFFFVNSLAIGGPTTLSTPTEAWLFKGGTPVQKTAQARTTVVPSCVWKDH